MIEGEWAFCMPNDHFRSQGERGVQRRSKIDHAILEQPISNEKKVMGKVTFYLSSVFADSDRDTEINNDILILQPHRFHI